ncbi:TetR/AcrR family transcriptional regulator C-terminal domain-containing protein [Enemella sp. A6]|uniref:TetR/AcrR family transcriptional regulator C-terminal domain-containing protein n=1 Tax=Enemella sp. A6 TaxID=3440152 RepID=UPI003EB80D4C
MLTRADVLQAAADILDEFGLADLSMRRVAGSLGVQPSALYTHLPDKQTLLAGVADLILAEVAEPLGRWRPAVEEWAADLRRVLLEHRDAAELVITARGFGLSRHDTTRHPTTLLAAAGLTPDEARIAATTLLHLVLGQVAEEQARQDWERFAGPQPDTEPGADRSFEIGVGLLLDGVEARL